jgi:hypothetical protein
MRANLAAIEFPEPLLRICSLSESNQNLEMGVLVFSNQTAFVLRT